MSDLRDATGLRSTCRVYTEVQFEYEPATAAVWGYMNQRGNPCFNLGLLKDLRAFGSELTANSGHVDFEGAMHKVHYYVAGSRVPRVYNLGGDLALFLLLIARAIATRSRITPSCASTTSMPACRTISVRR